MNVFMIIELVFMYAWNFPLQAAMFLIQTMDNIVEKDYVVVYVHTAASRENQPDLNFIKDIVNLVDIR